MTFQERMFAETHAPMPRWLYLLDKPLHSIAITAIIVALTRWPALWVACIVVVMYVGVGLYLWDTAHKEPWFGPGSYTGDALYHLLPSLPAPLLVSDLSRWEKWVGLVVLLLIWWQLDTDGYGPMRDA